MPESPRDYNQALLWFREQQKKPFGSAPTPSGDWGGYCLMDSRMAYLIPPLASSAAVSWEICDPEDKHPGTNPDDAPLGSALIWKGGSKGYGHIAIAARDFRNGTSAVWSNDLVRYGMLDKAARSATTNQWGQKYVGYMTAINDYDLRLKEKKPPKPKQDKPYKSILKAIDRMEAGRERAREQKDWADVKLFTAEIMRLKALYAKLRHA